MDANPVSTDPAGLLHLRLRILRLVREESKLLLLTNPRIRPGQRVETRHPLPKMQPAMAEKNHLTISPLYSHPFLRFTMPTCTPCNNNLPKPKDSLSERYRGPVNRSRLPAFFEIGKGHTPAINQPAGAAVNVSAAEKSVTHDRRHLRGD